MNEHIPVPPEKRLRLTKEGLDAVREGLESHPELATTIDSGLVGDANEGDFMSRREWSAIRGEYSQDMVLVQNDRESGKATVVKDDGSLAVLLSDLTDEEAVNRG